MREVRDIEEKQKESVKQNANPVARAKADVEEDVVNQNVVNFILYLTDIIYYIRF